jgi:GLPGLI family protein
MRKHFMLLSFICFFNSFSQVKTGTIEYGLTFAEDEELDTGQLSNYLKDAKKNCKYLTYKLDFNQNEMVFYKSENLSTDDNGNTSFAEAFSGVNGNYFREKDTNILYNEITQKHLEHVVVTKELKVNWTLLNETKMIDSYLCYKAVATIDIVNTVGTFKRNLLAWYCPKIPVPFGPKGYGGLPGLILQLQDRNVVFGVKKLTLNPNKLIVSKPPKIRTIAEIEFEKELDKYAPK